MKVLTCLANQRRFTQLIRSLAVLFVAMLCCSDEAFADVFDLVIRGGEIIDGTGSRRYRADVAVRDGVIAEIGMLSNSHAHQVVDAAGKLVVPGFIDLHSHAESGLVSDEPARRSAPNLITQGITTVVV